jgi:hypothetical protein
VLSRGRRIEVRADFDSSTLERRIARHMFPKRALTKGGNS